MPTSYFGNLWVNAKRIPAHCLWCPFRETVSLQVIGKMPLFFKKIRHQLLAESLPGVMASKFSKYMLYALGEIVLVVVGILIALSINNWNEGLKLEILELEYLERISTDLNADTRYFNRQIVECEAVIDLCYQYIHQAYEVQKTKEDYTQLIELFTDRTENLVVQNSTYLELNNAGKLSIFKNQQLKDSLIALHRDYEYAASRIREFNEYHTNLLSSTKIYPTKYSKRRAFIFDKPHMFNAKEWEFINDPTSREFRDLEWVNTIYLLKHFEAMEFHKALLTKIEFLTALIKEELEQRS